MLKIITHIILTTCLIIFLLTPGCRNIDHSYESGLIGIYYSEPNLTSVKAIITLNSLEQNWDDHTDFITGSSGEWNGYIIAPETGEIVFKLETNRQIILKIGAEFRTEATPQATSATLSLPMVKDELHPVQIIFINDEIDNQYGYFSIRWQLPGSNYSSISTVSLVHDKEHEAELAWLAEPDLAEINYDQFLRADARNIIIYYEPNRFAGWPANTGIWSWGDEILVGFNRAYYKENKYHHAIDRSKPGKTVLARSLDGGETWNIEEPENFNGQADAGPALESKLNFNDSRLSLRLLGTGFLVSMDKGKSWNGTYSYTGLEMDGITTRTDYIFNGQDDAFFFLSVKDKSVSAILQDRSFCARTADGGKSFKFISWMAETDSIRSVMSSTVRLSENHLVSAMRRRYDAFDRTKKQLAQNYITLHQSLDNGKTWSYMNKICDTDRGLRNGNPPSLIQLSDGRLCVTYGYRSVPYGIRAKLSSDKGQTWSREIILRNDARNFDFGYTRTVQREDGMVVTIYYYTTEEYPEQHIAATIWDPDKIRDY